MDLNGRRVHLMGIGGAGVSALVPLLRRRGAVVDGCDGAASPTTDRLAVDGVPVAIGHDPAHVRDADLVIHTAAVPADHPELAAARARGAEVVGRGAFLGRLLADGPAMAVTGSHGKTSTTWFLGHLLAGAGLDPTVIVGGTVASLGGGVRAGAGWTVAEADESDGSFAAIAPRVAVVTNLDHEHLRHYGSFNGLQAAVAAWLSRIPADGLAVLPADETGARLAAACRCRTTTCGADEGDWRLADLRLEGEGSRAAVVHGGAVVADLAVPLPGVHMAVNALMALAAARHAAPAAVGDLSACERVRRRFTVHGHPRGVRVVEDYGHHPAEVRATIAAARLAGGRVHVLFQPHRHTRTADCFDGFAAAFDQAHTVALLPIYAAGESAVPGVDHRRLADAVAGRRAGLGESPVAAVDAAAAGCALLAAQARPGDTCLVLGAGDVGAAAPLLIRTIEAQP